MPLPLPSLSIPSAPSGELAFQVTAFHGRESLGEPYGFDLRLISHEPLDEGTLLGALARLKFRGGLGSPRLFQGRLFQVRHLGRAREGWAYRVRLAPRITALGLDQRHRVFTGRTLGQILRACLEEAGLGACLRFPGEEEDPILPFAHQCGENTLAFLSRLLERQGFGYRFVQEAEGEVLLVTRVPVLGGAALAAPWVPEGERGRLEGIHRVSWVRQAFPARLRLLEVDPRNPALRRQEECELAGGLDGTWTARGEGAGALAGALENDAWRIQGRGNLGWMEAGRPFLLQGHPEAEMDGEYLLIRVEHRGSPEGGLRDGFHYRNRFSAQDALRPFRPGWRTPWPCLPGLSLGFTQGEEAGPVLDPERGGGRYRVRMPFHPAGDGAGPASDWAPLLHPGGGWQQGLHFPLRDGTPVLLSYLDGDPHRPAIAGVLPEEGRPSVTTEAEPLRCALVSEAGHLLEAGRGEQSPLKVSSSGELDVKSGGSTALRSETPLALRTEGDLGLRSAGRLEVHAPSGSWQSLAFSRAEAELGHALFLGVGSQFAGILGRGTDIQLGRVTHLDLGPFAGHVELGGGRNASVASRRSLGFGSWRGFSSGVVWQASDDWCLQLDSAPPLRASLLAPMSLEALLAAIAILAALGREGGKHLASLLPIADFAGPAFPLLESALLCRNSLMGRSRNDRETTLASIRAVHGGQGQAFEESRVCLRAGSGQRPQSEVLMSGHRVFMSAVGAPPAAGGVRPGAGLDQTQDRIEFQVDGKGLLSCGPDRTTLGQLSLGGRPEYGCLVRCDPNEWSVELACGDRRLLLCQKGMEINSCHEEAFRLWMGGEKDLAGARLLTLARRTEVG